MRIKVSLNTQDEWNDCWLETRYIGTSEMFFESFIYPVIWPKVGKQDGFYRITSKPYSLEVRSWIKECEDYIKQPPFKKSNEIYDRTITAMQKISSILKRVFPW